MSLLSEVFKQSESRKRFKMDSKSRTPAKSYSSYKSRARRKEINFLISREEFLELSYSPCNYCGKIRDGGNGLDRVNPDGPYSIENVVPCCSECNYMKHILTIPEFVSKIGEIHRYTSTPQKKVNNYYQLHYLNNSAVQ